MTSQVVIPEATRKRMLLLLDLLDSYSRTGSGEANANAKITSAKISELTGWKDSLIRHDLWLLGYNKGISNGYQTDDLRNAVGRALGVESNEKNCCIVGLNRLGAALLDEGMMEGTCFKIKAGFDSNVNRVEILRSTFPLYPTTEMNYVIRHENISLCDSVCCTCSRKLIFYRNHTFKRKQLLPGRKSVCISPSNHKLPRYIID